LFSSSSIDDDDDDDDVVVIAQGGVYGVPYFNDEALDKFFSEVFDDVEINPLLQDVLSFAGYWRNPYNITAYVQLSEFLADINNEKESKNQTYKDNLASLNVFGMTFSTVDQVGALLTPSFICRLID